MMQSADLERTVSLALKVSRDGAEEVLNHPDIFEVISEDGMEHWTLPEGPIYLCGYIPDLIGCFVLHKQSKAIVECHVQVLPKYRKEWAHVFGKYVIEWTWANTGARKLVAQIPFLYPNVLRFSEAMGFTVEGINRASFLKHGALHDQWYVGLCRS